MKTSDIAVEAIENLNQFLELTSKTENADSEYLKSIEFFIHSLKKEVFGNIVKHEYIDFWYKNRKKVNVKKFINNPKKTLELFQNLKDK
jgi:hypothetical protein